MKQEAGGQESGFELGDLKMANVAPAMGVKREIYISRSLDPQEEREQKEL